VRHVVLVSDPIAAAGLALLTARPEIEVVPVVGDPAGLARELPRADVLLVRSATRVTAELIALAGKLKLIGRAGMGVDNIDVAAATQRGIVVLNTPGANTVSAAEHTFALLLALARRVPWAAESMRAGAWNRSAFGGTELAGKLLGIVGLGRIGLHVAGIARGFGMRLVAHDPFVPASRGADLGVALLPLEEVLATADVVTLHLPFAPDTRHLIDARCLALMKPTAFLINAARGGLVDEAALLDALERGALAGAALDVFDREPLPADSPLRAAPRLVLTPHLAASTAEAQERVSVELCGAVRDALLGGAVRGAVNGSGG
jgi:D-3-phosphoglycerate dehydrogenase